MTDFEELEKKLAEEKFQGELPEWRDASWGDVNVRVVEDDENWYYAHHGVIYVQAKQGDNTPHCFEDGAEIEHQSVSVNIRLKNDPFPLASHGVETKHVPYCPTCESKPAGHADKTQTLTQLL